MRPLPPLRERRDCSLVNGTFESGYIQLSEASDWNTRGSRRCALDGTAIEYDRRETGKACEQPENVCRRRKPLLVKEETVQPQGSPRGIMYAGERARGGGMVARVLLVLCDSQLAELGQQLD